jgi:hypothetical protein
VGICRPTGAAISAKSPAALESDPTRGHGAQERAFAHPSVTGLDESIPLSVIHSPGTRFCPGSARGPPPDGVLRGQADLSTFAWS